MIRATLPVVLVIVLAVTAGVLLAQYQAPSAADSAAGQLAAASSHGSRWVLFEGEGRRDSQGVARCEEHGESGGRPGLGRLPVRCRD